MLWRNPPSRGRNWPCFARDLALSRESLRWHNLPRYDMALHAVAVGFVLSMVFGQALIILPAIATLAEPSVPPLRHDALHLFVATVRRRQGGESGIAQRGLSLHAGAARDDVRRLHGDRHDPAPEPRRPAVALRHIGRALLHGVGLPDHLRGDAAAAARRVRTASSAVLARLKHHGRPDAARPVVRLPGAARQG